MIRCHLPLITARIIFIPQLLPDVPIITPRIDFQMEDLNPSRDSQGPEETLGSDDELNESLSALSSMESDEDEGEVDQRIPKPLGEAGRPGSGGYNLKDVLGWANADFDKIQVSRPRTTHSQKPTSTM
jgi:hypothetical protein